jgi:hypothetical protein
MLMRRKKGERDNKLDAGDGLLLCVIGIVNAHFQTVILALKDHKRASVCKVLSLNLVLVNFGNNCFTSYRELLLEINNPVF